MSHFIPLSVPNLRGNELKYLTTAVEEEWVSTGGPYIRQFEQQLALFTGVEDAVACQSGTAGLHLALMELGVQRDEAVLVPTLTFIASVNPVHYIGAHPIFMDCDDSLCIDPIKLREFCENECEKRDGALYEKASGRRIRVVVVVHVFGNLADMEAINDIARDYGLLVLEDACEALGSRWCEGRYEGRHAGTVGDAGVFSFNGNKIVTTGGGGMIICSNPARLEHMRFVSTQAKKDPMRFIHEEVGYNYRLTNVQAALGVAQMEQMPTFLATKKTNYLLYKGEGVELLPFREGVEPNYWFYSYMAGNKRDYLIEELGKREIQTRPVWALIHSLKPYENERAYKIERAQYYWENIVNLPCSTNLSADDVREVAAAIKEIMR